MQVLALPLPLLKAGDDIALLLMQQRQIKDTDIIVVSSKAIATVEGAAIDLNTLSPSRDAKLWSEKTGKSPEFCEAVIQETLRMHGRIIGYAPSSMLTELIPDGFPHGVILAPNAGLDESNIAEGFAIGWPIDPVTSAKKLRRASGNVGVIISDSCVRPRRKGVTAFALTVAGLHPFKSEVGNTDLFQKPMRVTVEAIADQLAVIGNMLMGNAAQSIPACIIRDHNLPLTDDAGWVEGIDPNEDLFRAIL